MTSIKNRFHKIISGEDITIQELLKPLSLLVPRIKWMLLIICVPVIIFSSIGYIAKKTSPKEYEAKCVLLTDQAAIDPSQQGSLAALAMIAGVNGAQSGNNSNGSDLYQIILSNKPFLIELSEKQIYFLPLKKSITLRQYFKKDAQKDLVTSSLEKVKSFLSNLLGGSNMPFEDNESENISRTKFLTDSLNASFSNKVYVSELNTFQKRIIGILGARIKFVQQGKLITLTVKMPEAKLSAEATKIVLNLLVEYATRFKVGKLIEEVKFLEARTAEAENKYKESQQQVAQFKDKNYNVIFESVHAKERQLENNFVLYSTIYNQLVAQLEQSKIQLKKETPLFSVVEPVYIPEETASVNSIFYSYFFNGLLIGILLNAVFIYIIFKKEKRLVV